MALGHLGAHAMIQDHDTDESAEAKACRIYFEIAKKKVLEDFDWPFARQYADLALVSENPNADYTRSYRYPSGCLAIRGIVTGTVHTPSDARPTYQIGSDATGRLIFCNESPATIKYTKEITDLNIFSMSFVMAQSYLLASMIAPRITGGDAFNRQEKAMNMYFLQIAKAQSNAANEEQLLPEPGSSFERVRD